MMAAAEQYDATIVEEASAGSNRADDDVVVRPAAVNFQVFATASKRRRLDAPAHQQQSWSCGACTFENHGSWTSCKMCETPRVPSQQHQPAPRPRPPLPSSNPMDIAAAAEALGLRDGFRPWQADVLEAWGSGKDCLILSGTGSGKSVCFQAPALLRPRHGDTSDTSTSTSTSTSIVLVVSPLISLMSDQVQGLRKASRGRVSCCFLGSAQPDKGVERDALRGKFSLVYVCPESLERLAPGFGDLHRSAASPATRIALFAVDEAHCVSKWGGCQLCRTGTRGPSFPLVLSLMTLTHDVTSDMWHVALAYDAARPTATTNTPIYVGWFMQCRLRVCARARVHILYIYCDGLKSFFCLH